MAESLAQDRILPSLLERLTDLEPDKQKESREARVMSMRRYRESVLRDLAWLLNTTNMGIVEEVRAYPALASSVVNYGVPDLAGSTTTTVDPNGLARAIRQAILTFEPRIMPETLRVDLKVNEDSRLMNRLEMTIDGDLWASPVPVHVLVNTALDLETGAIGLTDAG
jgi:type VI secretion system protein ImpF